MIDKGIVEFLDAKTPPAVLKRLLALNNAHAKELSWLDAQKLASMISTAFLARRIGNIDAFILAFDQDADYQGENFQWSPPPPAATAWHAASTNISSRPPLFRPCLSSFLGYRCFG
jgi:glutathione S-transferase